MIIIKSIALVFLVIVSTPLWAVGWVTGYFLKFFVSGYHAGYDYRYNWERCIREGYKLKAKA